jgi:hypothetical protein
MVTTPVYIGTDIEIFKCELCPHEKFSQVAGPAVRLGFEMFLEKCDACTARRARYRRACVPEPGRKA